MKAPVKAGREQGMQEPHEKGIANHLDPESCADVGNHVGEALTGAHVGQPSSSDTEGATKCNRLPWRADPVW